MRAIQIQSTGGPEVMDFVELDPPTPGSDDLLVAVAAAGVNFIDTYQRGGLYSVTLPYQLGLEGAGEVVAVGDSVTAFAPGDRVAWSSAAGSYAEQVVVPAAVAVSIPDSVSFDLAAAVMLQGMTAHYLAMDAFRLTSDHTCLIHAAAGGTGRLLVQIAKRVGATIVATAGSDEKLEKAREAGADHLVNYRTFNGQPTLQAAIEAAVGPRGVHVVYDGVGAATFDTGLKVLASRGTMVSFGNASGPVQPISPLTLSTNGSLFLTRPTLFDYIFERADLERRAHDLFAWIAADELDVVIADKFALADAPDAHRALQGRATSGKLLLIP